MPQRRTDVCRVRDAGLGFCTETGIRSALGLGLARMEERAHLVRDGSSITFSSRTRDDCRTAHRSDGKRPLHEPTYAFIIADDHQILAEGVAVGLLEPEFVDRRRGVQWSAAGGSCQKHSPGVIVADVTMPALNGIDAAVLLPNADVTSRLFS